MWRKQRIVEMIQKTGDLNKIKIIYTFVVQLLE